MNAFLLKCLIVVPFVAGGRAAVRTRQTSWNGTTVSSQVESGIQTECKTCPYSQCTNQAAYEYGREMNLTCWTSGDTIVDTSTWFKTTDNCYVTEWDIVEGNYTSQLPYCGDVAKTITTGASRTVYNTECNIIPEFVGETADHTKMYKPEVDLTVTCSTTDGEGVLGNHKWYKTLSNCYVPEAQIEFVDDSLDSCGPIPFMEAKMRQPDAETASSSEAFTRRGALSERHGHEHKRWLYLTQIGDDSAKCLSDADSQSEEERTYSFGDYIIVQCATRSNNTADNDQIYLLTTEFCWVNDTLTDPGLVDDEERSQRYPNCNLFVDAEV